MRVRSIGSLEVSVVGLGCNNLGRRVDQAGTDAVVGACLESGVTLFDTAESYGDGASEELLGAALGARRDQVVLATKFGWLTEAGEGRGGARPDAVKRACEGSLRRLGTDRIDLYQLHKPHPDTPIADTLGALTELRDAGKVREIGCSNFSVAQIDAALSASAAGGLAPFASVQNQWSLLHREPETDGVADACARHGLAVLPYFPLASGMLTGKYRRGEPMPEGTRLAGMPADRARRYANERNFDTVERLEAFCAARGRTLLELAVSWLAGQDVVASVIAGATRPEQVRANAATAGWELDAGERAEVDRISGLAAQAS